MIVTFYQHKQKYKQVKVEEDSDLETVLEPASPTSLFGTPPPPILQPAWGGEAAARGGAGKGGWPRRKWGGVVKMTMLCGHLKRRHQQPYNPALQHGPCDSDSEGDFYYFYPHKVKDRSALKSEQLNPMTVLNE
ncbi:hypothetical protein ACOMHN_062044 [Nucella lapillus]